jgi:RNA polymerase sigma factor (sigma-70 family)
MPADVRRRSVARSPYEEHRDYVLATLNRRCGWLSPDEREAIFHDAYALMLERQRDGRLDSGLTNAYKMRSYLVQVAIHKALDAGKAAERRRTQPIDDAVIARAAPGVALDDHAAARFDDRRVREIVDELSDRKRAIIKLRYFYDRSPSEVQRLLGISERIYRRDLERAIRQLADRYELVRNGEYCETRRSLILAFVAGIAGPGRVREARAHLAGCPACMRWANDLRLAADRAGAVAPLPVLAHPHGLDRAIGVADAIRDLADQAATGIKHHMLGLLARSDAGTAGYLTAARPGAVAAAIAGCVAIGSGATYCAVQGLPDPAGVLRAKKAEPREPPTRRPPTRQPPRRRAGLPARAPASAAVAASTPERSPARAPSRRARTTHRASPRPRSNGSVEQEFGLGQGTAVAGAARPDPARSSARAATTGAGAKAGGATAPRAAAPTQAAAEFGPERP